MKDMRKRLFIVLTLMVCGIAGAWANEVTPEQAREIAQQFMKSHGSRRAAPEMEQPVKVSGLYIFNINNNGGYVIVSNDDQTTPILGFSDSGSIDPDNMPSNMRAWLQGYADEIAWLQKNQSNGAIVTPAADKARRRAITNHDPIGPLLTTTWDQGTPYNNLTPYYGVSGGNYVFSRVSGTGYKHCATGCVATAMAQVMYYHKWPQSETQQTPATQQIPAYKWESANIWLPNQNMTPLPATSFDWDKMLPTYEKDNQVVGEDNEKEAIATLMQYCGYSLEMDYGPESGSNTVKVADALKNYFGYSETTKFVARSCYTYDNWKELIYHELSELRPVVYGGQSSGGGHEFVCDGYKYEDNTDLFHINWGWGGTSDGYFVLQTLNPNEQGIGGSSSTDGFHYGQDAVIGIQKDGGTGTTLNVQTNNYSLTINSISLSKKTIALGESVDVTLNVSNSGDDAYDGDLWLVKGSTAFLGKMFLIPVETTNRDYVISYTPTDVGSVTLYPSFIKNNGKFYEPPVPDDLSVTLNVVNQTPTGLTASDITPATAIINWTNVGEATKWNLRNRTATATIEDFNDFDVNTFNTNHNVNNWIRVSFGGYGCNLKLYSDDDNKYFKSPSYENGTNVNPFGGLRTPLFTFGGSISFYTWGENENFVVLMSIDNQTYSYITDIITATANPTQYTVDLSEYAGQSGYIAIAHYFNSGHTSDSYLYIDNVSYIQPAGDWKTTSGITSDSYTLTGLNSETIYEVQMQAVNTNGGKWSDPVMFTTEPLFIELGNDNTNNAELIETWDTYTGTVTLTGRTLYKDSKWNTICLPFDVTLADSPLAGAVARSLSEASISGTTLNLTFGDATNTLEAGTPYIIKWATDNEHPTIVSPVFSDVTISKDMHNVSFSGGSFCGNYNYLQFNSDDTSILLIGINNQGNSVLYYPKPDTTDPENPIYPTLGACRAYFHIGQGEGGIGTSSVRSYVLNFGDDDSATGIIAIGDSQLSTLNSQLSGWYTLDGRKLNSKPTAKGVYVKNGKKIVIK